MNNPYFSSSVAPQPRTFSTLGSGGRPVNATSFTLSATRDAFVSYSIGFTGLFAGTINLQISVDNSVWVTVNTIGAGSGDVQNLVAMIPKGYFVRLQTTGGTTNFQNGQEVLL